MWFCVTNILILHELIQTQPNMRFVTLLSIFILCINIAHSQKDTLGSLDLSTEKYFIKDINISIFPPKYFRAAEQIHGFVHPMTASTIQIQEVTGTLYTILADEITPEYIREQGFEYVSKVEVKTKNGKGAVCFLVRFEAKGVTFERMMLFTGDYTRTIWASANYPTVAGSLMRNAIMESLLTIEF
jgi:hypothetical protein